MTVPRMSAHPSIMQAQLHPQQMQQLQYQMQMPMQFQPQAFSMQPQQPAVQAAPQQAQPQQLATAQLPQAPQQQHTHTPYAQTPPEAYNLPAQHAVPPPQSVQPGQGGAVQQQLIHKHHTKTNVVHPPQPMPPPLSDPPAPEDPEEGILEPDCQPGGAPSVSRPCLHNDWDDVRTRKGSKILRCRLCQRKWKLASSTVARCASFLQNICPNGLQCAFLHVHKKKSHSAALDMQMEEFMPPLASPEATPPASPNALLAALRDYVMKPPPESPVTTDTAELMEMLRMAGLGCVSDPPTPASTKAGAIRTRSRHGSLKGDEPADSARDLLAGLPPSPAHRMRHAAAGQAGSPSKAGGGPGLAARRAFAKQAVAIPAAPAAAPVVKSITPTGVVFMSPTAGPSGELVEGVLSFEQLREFVHGTPTSAKGAAAKRRMLMGVSPRVGMKQQQHQQHQQQGMPAAAAHNQAQFSPCETNADSSASPGISSVSSPA